MPIKEERHEALRCQRYPAPPREVCANGGERINRVRSIPPNGRNICGQGRNGQPYHLGLAWRRLATLAQRRSEFEFLTSRWASLGGYRIVAIRAVKVIRASLFFAAPIYVRLIGDDYRWTHRSTKHHRSKAPRPWGHGRYRARSVAKSSSIPGSEYSRTSLVFVSGCGSCRSPLSWRKATS